MLANELAPAYIDLQNDKEEKVLDDLPTKDIGVPPLQLLYTGFVRFLDAINNPKPFARDLTGGS